MLIVAGNYAGTVVEITGSYDDWMVVQTTMGRFFVEHGWIYLMGVKFRLTAVCVCPD